MELQPAVEALVFRNKRLQHNILFLVKSYLLIKLLPAVEVIVFRKERLQLILHVGNLVAAKKKILKSQCPCTFPIQDSAGWQSCAAKEKKNSQKSVP